MPMPASRFGCCRQQGGTDQDCGEGFHGAQLQRYFRMERARSAASRQVDASAGVAREGVSGSCLVNAYRRQPQLRHAASGMRSTRPTMSRMMVLSSKFLGV
jgi:hypothetical protein